ncbi:hypothetical protein C900_05372 [Fulvivirga imtechensis AK7]|uniref:Phage virion morphogenesis protein n=1 Tax=Fulvivirga imtechensis AK7 TaxID=1237149 RepID=L8JJU1_9BACT|nr:hypothetical protein [Fulvivirga imtechensis]ELR69176.1 hypothetical protein C900_05372 [Fulvivirga imtechensis AK7]
MPHYKVVIRRLEALKAELPIIVANEMVNHAIDNIRAGSWDGRPWPARKAFAPRNRGRGLLIDTGDGLRSIASKIQKPYVLLKMEDYMAAHNEGADINVTQNVRSHTRRRAGRSMQVRAHSRNMNFKLPQRQFAGESKVLSENIRKVFEKRFRRVFT